MRIRYLEGFLREVLQAVGLGRLVLYLPLRSFFEIDEMVGSL